jgi:hypothetical protein
MPANPTKRALATFSATLSHEKCPGKPRTSFVGLPIAKFFQPVFGERVFQQPRIFRQLSILEVVRKEIGIGRDGYTKKVQLDSVATNFMAVVYDLKSSAAFED